MSHLFPNQYFNPKDDYNKILEDLKRDFDERWSNTTPSPSTNLENYHSKSVLGMGSFGTVLLVREKSGKKFYAAKQMSKEDLVRLKQVNHVHNEKMVLASLHFPFLVNLIESSKDFDYLYFIMPFVSGGELFHYHRKVRKFTEKQSRFYGAQVVMALEYMHHMKLVYRDLKPENILIDNKGYLLLTDFGFTKRLDMGRTSTLCGTPEYLAPEVIQLRPYNTCVDWWALGILLYEFATGHSPFSQYNNDVILMYSKISLGDYRMPSFFSMSFKSLVSSLLQVEFNKRLGSGEAGAKDIKNHQWFQGVDWFALLNKEINAPYVPIIIQADDTSHFESYDSKPKLKSSTNRYPELFTNF